MYNYVYVIVNVNYCTMNISLHIRIYSYIHVTHSYVFGSFCKPSSRKAPSKHSLVSKLEYLRVHLFKRTCAVRKSSTPDRAPTNDSTELLNSHMNLQSQLHICSISTTPVFFCTGLWYQRNSEKMGPKQLWDVMSVVRTPISRVLTPVTHL